GPRHRARPRQTPGGDIVTMQRPPKRTRRPLSRASIAQATATRRATWERVVNDPTADLIMRNLIMLAVEGMPALRHAHGVAPDCAGMCPLAVANEDETRAMVSALMDQSRALETFFNRSFRVTDSDASRFASYVAARMEAERDAARMEAGRFTE